MRTAIFPTDYSSLDEIREFVGQAAAEAGFDSRSVYAIQLAADEACSNIIEHAYGEASEGKIECTCSLTDTDLVIILRDYGVPFDLDSVPAPNLSPDLEKRKIGGLGVYLMRKLMDEVTFETSPEFGNVLTMKKHRKKADE